MKNLAYSCFVVLLLVSCSEYQKVLNDGPVDAQYKMATKMYEAKKYYKALQLFERVTPSFRGKPQLERIQYMVAQSNFNTKGYTLAGYYFDRFTKNYPKSSKKEEAAFLSAFSYYKAAPVYSLDPIDTYKAMESFQLFMDAYPDSDRFADANKYYKELRYKLERKAFEIAKTYYKTAVYDARNYSASIVAFDNLLSEYLGTKFKEEALYFRLKAAHDYALKSTQRRKEARIKAAVKAHKKLQRNFPESKFMGDANSMLATLQTAQKQFAKKS